MLKKEAHRSTKFDLRWERRQSMIASVVGLAGSRASEARNQASGHAHLYRIHHRFVPGGDERDLVRKDLACPCR
jgi:hypothetical protein